MSSRAAERPGEVLVDWPGFVAAAVITPAGVAQRWGDEHRAVRIASVSKLVTGYALLVALEEGAVDLDDEAGPPGATVGDLYCHAAGLDFDSPRVLAPPRTRRIYSNTGWEVLCAHLEARAGITWQDYLAEAVTSPLGMVGTIADGSPAKDLWAPVTDLERFVTELFGPTLVARETLDLATTPRLPELGGVLPGIGVLWPNPWGLGFEIRGRKSPHWTGHRNSPATFGHFGGSGTFLWLDPDAGLALVAVGGRDFGPWALEVWPRFSDAVLLEFG
ncbi:MAG TPA: serine hydrolase domain-containing protein [Microthrixaceae bacterium]|nr:serine hydrolase domain-containing protein [Microthrixaceae bacterium]